MFQNMKSIEDTLNLVGSIIKTVVKSCTVNIALAGGYAVISHGVSRTTSDVDFYIYSDLLKKNPSEFFKLFNHAVPERFELKVVEGSKMTEDPFPYDILLLYDKNGEYPRIDFIIPRYKWEEEQAL